MDFEERARLLVEADGCSAADALARADDGLPKLWLLHRLLELRRRRPGAFSGDYIPLPAGDGALAFSRGAELVVGVAIRPSWGGSVELPDGAWVDLDGRGRRGVVSLPDLLEPLGVAVLERAS